MKASIIVGMVLIAIGIVAFMFFGSGGSGNTVKVLTGDTTSPIPSGEVREFTMTAKAFDFTPGNIEVNEGDTVILHITSTDVEHGIAIPEFGVSQKLPVGEETTVEFVADKKGTYTFFCNVFCGSGHKGMRGTLTVN